MFRISGLIVLAISCQYALSTEVTCYFTNWAIYRSGIAAFSTSDIAATQCTIISYAFVGIDEDTGNLTMLDAWSDINRDSIKGVLAQKEKNADLKVVISMGGWNEGSIKYSKMVSDPELRSNFTASVLDFIQTYGFDGFDLDWEYPAARGGSEDDVENLVVLLKEMKAAFEPFGYRLLITVSGAGHQVTDSYNVSAISDTVDFIQLMMYDLRVSSSVNYTAHHTPLYPSSLDVDEENKILNVEGGINQWISLGANASKLILGMAFYGRTWNLVNESEHGLYAASNGPGPAGPITVTDGFLSYQEICYYYPNYTYVWDEEMQSPYAYEGTTWFSYDSPKSIKLKTEYALSKGLGGVMMWSFDYDDFNDSCGGGKYPLLTAMNEAIEAFK